MRRTILAAGLLALPLTANAESPEDALESRFRAAEVLIDAHMARDAVPGAAIGVVHDQSLIWSHQYGVESLETGAPVTDDTLFSICSVSKLFTGVAVMKLVEEGRLLLDAPVSPLFGDAMPADDTGAEEPVTVRNILSHVSGLPREGIDDFWGGNGFPNTDELLASSERHSQLYRPYVNWQYSNLGMAMLGEVVEGVSGETWANYVEEMILTPLGMDNTTTDMPFDRVGAGFANGYYIRSPKGERKPVEPHQFRAYAAAAGMASSVNDLAKFASWNFRLLEEGGEEVLKATTLKNMQRVHWVGSEFDDPAWGLAFATRRYGDETMWGHGGYCPGARTEYVLRLPSKIGVMMMTSANDISPGDLTRMVYDLTNSAITAVYGEDAKESSRKKKNRKVDLSDYEGHYYVENYDWDVYIGMNEDSLFSFHIFSDYAVRDIETYIHDEGDTFYRERDDGTRGEPVIFERDEDGRVTAVVQHSFRFTKR